MKAKSLAIFTILTVLTLLAAVCVGCKDKNGVSSNVLAGTTYIRYEIYTSTKDTVGWSKISFLDRKHYEFWFDYNVEDGTPFETGTYKVRGNKIECRTEKGEASYHSTNYDTYIIRDMTPYEDWVFHRQNNFERFPTKK